MLGLSCLGYWRRILLFILMRIAGWHLSQNKMQFFNFAHFSWKWMQSGNVAECRFQKSKKLDLSVSLNGSWVVVVEDFQARLMVYFH